MMVTYSKFWPKGGVNGVLHHVSETLIAFQFKATNRPKPHSLLFIGGLGDGIGTTSYLSDLSKALEPTDWSLYSVSLSSSYQSWGLGHLDRDTDEIAQYARYIRDINGGKGKLVLMGHSTGSNDVLHYLCHPNPHTSKLPFDPTLKHIKRPAVDGAIMQAAVSDRQVVHLLLASKEGFNGKTQAEIRAAVQKMEDMSREAEKYNDDDIDTLLPLWLSSHVYPANTPLSCRRFLSLFSPDSPSEPSEDDLFSSDLSDQRLKKTFGAIHEQGLLQGKLCVLLSGRDQSVPDWVNKNELLSKWQSITNGDAGMIWDNERSGVIPNASHALSDDDQAEPRRILAERVVGFLRAAEE